MCFPISLFLQWQKPMPANGFSFTSIASNFITCDHFNTWPTTLCQRLDVLHLPQAAPPVTGWSLQKADSKMEIIMQKVGEDIGLGRGRHWDVMQSECSFYWSCGDFWRWNNPLELFTTGVRKLSLYISVPTVTGCGQPKEVAWLWQGGSLQLEALPVASLSLKGNLDSTS